MITQDLHKYDTRDTKQALYSNIEIEHIDEVKSILKQEKIKYKVMYRGPRMSTSNCTLKKDAIKFSIYAQNVEQTDKRKALLKEQADKREALQKNLYAIMKENNKKHYSKLIEDLELFYHIAYENFLNFECSNAASEKILEHYNTNMLRKIEAQIAHYKSFLVFYNKVK